MVFIFHRNLFNVSMVRKELNMEEKKDYNQHLIGLIVIAIIFTVGFSVVLSACKLFLLGIIPVKQKNSNPADLITSSFIS